MNKKLAKKIGVQKAFESVTIGLIIFYLIGIFIFSNEGLKSLLWIQYLDLYNWVYIINWVASFYVIGYFIGRNAGKEILIKKRNVVFSGLKHGFLILFFAASLGCLLGFMTEGIENLGTNDNPIIDYFMKPIFWITLYGLVPTLLVGVFFAYRISHKGKLVE